MSENERSCIGRYWTFWTKGSEHREREIIAREKLLGWKYVRTQPYKEDYTTIVFKKEMSKTLDNIIKHCLDVPDSAWIDDSMKFNRIELEIIIDRVLQLAYDSLEYREDGTVDMYSILNCLEQ